MIDAIASASTTLLGVLSDWTEFLGANPRVFLGIVFGLLVSWGSTQHAKRLLGWSGARVTSIAFLLGAVPCFTISTLGILNPFPWTELWISVAVGLFTFTVYDFARALFRRKFPWYARRSPPAGGS